MIKTKEFNLGPTLFLMTYQVILLIGLPFYFYYAPPSLGMVLVSLLLLYLTGLSITAGYHRYYSHKSYKTTPLVEFFLLFFASMAGQGSALRWSYDHRIHHAHVDTDEDPYSIKKGFWYAHFGWIMEKPRQINPKVCSDLLKNEMVLFQHQHINVLMLATNLMAFLFVGWLLSDFLGAFVMALWVRLFALHHFTWFINSLAHTWGDKPFCQEQSAVNNWIISLLTFGEGYHNYHHTFANDYRNGIRWFHWDPTKWLIWTLNKLGLAESLRRVDPLTINKRMVIERRNLLVQRLSQKWDIKKEEFEKQINEIADRIVLKINEFYQLKKQYQQSKCKQLYDELKQLKRSLQQDWKDWKKLSTLILNPYPKWA